MTVEYPALGAVIIHQYYPGFVDVPTGSDYLIDSADAQGLVRVVGHMRPLVVVDFNNELVNRPHKQRVHTDIKRPVRGINLGAISMDATGHEGRKALIIAVEKEINGRTFRQDIYTSLEVRWEVQTGRAVQDLRPFDRLLVRFISTYRYLNPDTRLVLSDGIPDDGTPRRVAFHPSVFRRRAAVTSSRTAYLRFGQRPTALDTVVPYRGALAARSRRRHRRTGQARRDTRGLPCEWLCLTRDPPWN